MTISDLLLKAVEDYVAINGDTDLLEFMCVSAVDERNTLTIIADRTLHNIPEKYLVGEIYEFSHGSFDVSSSSAVETYLKERLRDLTSVLKKKYWRRVRVIVSGHAILSMHIKHVVYRVLHIDTEDIAYFGRSGYRAIAIISREDLFAASDL